jgi:hypothetical protein
MKIVSLLTSAFLVMFLASSSSTILAGNPRTRVATESSMTSPKLEVKNVTLLAREEKSPPPGKAPTSNRAIGLASVFLRLENTQEKDINLIIKSIQIQNVGDGRVQMASQSPQEVRLRPLENSENVFHLTNKTGYSGQGQVKAIITYQLGDQVAVIESSPVEVERH